MTTAVLFLPLAGSLAVLLVPRERERLIVAAGIAVTALELLLVVLMWLLFDAGGGVQLEQEATWIPSVDIGYRVGVDGLSLPLVGMTAVLFLACLVFSVTVGDRVKEYVALFLFLEMACIGVFVSLDLILFFVFWDLALVATYFVIAMWGHEGRERAALKFFLYTFLGSLALLLGIIGLFIFSDPRTFDMLAVIEQAPLRGHGVAGAFVMLTLVVAFAIKTPLVPFHTWLPPAHVVANAPGSAVLAGVLLKMGTYAFVRIAMSMLPEQWRGYALALVIIGAVSAIYGALVALAQASFKALVAYSSVNHMGYVLVGLGAAGMVADAPIEERELAVAGAINQMVAHGLITGLLFLLTGVLYRRARTYDFERFGGLAGSAPAFAGVTGATALAAFGLPGFALFIAELQIFVGSLDAVPWAVGISLLAVLVTAGMFLLALHRLFLGRGRERWAGFADMRPHELVPAALLMVPIVLAGVFPRWLLDVIEPSARTVVELVAR